jgi:two-component system sensor histidine kinase KdpD
MTFAVPLTVALLECRDGRIVRANAAFAALVGAAEPQRLVGRSPDDWLADAGDGLPDWSAGELRRGVAQPVACLLQPTQGGVRRVDVVSLGEGLWELHDRTELQQLGAEVRELGARLREARRALEAGRDQEAEERTRLDELLTLVSHELRTPVTVIAGFLKLLLGEEVGPLTDEQRRFLEECQRSVRRLDAFVADLLEAHGGRRGPAEGTAPVDASLAATVESVAAFLKPLLEEGGHRLHLALDDDAVRARFDPPRVEQILVNLIGNAMAHGRPGGEITVATRRLAAAGRAAIEVAVCDQGPGIPPEDRERVFDPYTRAGEGGAAGGLGLGLAICRSLVEAQGGTIRADEAPGGGARIAFTLPPAEEPA